MFQPVDDRNHPSSHADLNRPAAGNDCSMAEVPATCFSACRENQSDGFEPTVAHRNRPAKAALPLIYAATVTVIVMFGLTFMMWPFDSDTDRGAADGSRSDASDENSAVADDQLRKQAVAHSQLGRHLYVTGEYDEAIPELVQAIAKLTRVHQQKSVSLESRWQLAQMMTDLGNSHRLLGRLDQAESMFRKGLTIKLDVTSHAPDSQQYWLQLGKSYHDFGLLYHQCEDFANALQCFYEAIRWKRQVFGVSSESVDAQLELGISCAACARALDAADLGSWRQETETAYRKAYELINQLMVTQASRSVSFRPYYRVVRDYANYLCEHDADRLVEMIQACLQDHIQRIEQRAEDLAGHTVDAWQVGLLHALRYRISRMQDRSAADQAAGRMAREALSRLVAYSKKDTSSGAADGSWEYIEGRQQLAWLLLANASDVDRQDSRAAVSLAKQAVDAAPREPRYWTTLGVAQYRSGQWAKAATSLTRSLQLPFGDDGVNRLFLAMAWQQLGARELADQEFEQARDWVQRYHPQNRMLGRFLQEAAALFDAGT